jgi:transposase-like protein
MHRETTSQPSEFQAAREALLERGFDGAAEVLRLLLNEAMRVERASHLHAQPYERSVERTGSANGFKPKTLLTRLGEMTLDVPQTRDSSFYPSALDKGTRTERSVNLAMAEMYVQGVSSRKVCEVLQKLVGPEIHLTSTQVSRAVQGLDAGLLSWRSRTLGETPYVMLDARYERVRYDRQIIDCAVLVAVGITPEGTRRVLGVSVAMSEAEVHWRDFLKSLVERGVCGIKYIVSDAHAGLEAARKAVFPSVPWQRCQFHLQQNASKYVSRLELKAGVAKQLRAVFAAPSKDDAERLLALAVDAWRKGGQAKLADWAEANVSQGFAVYTLPEAHRVRLRTTNPLERINRELKRRTRVVSIFPNPDACLRLVSALLAELDEQWLTTKMYINFQKTD